MHRKVHLFLVALAVVVTAFVESSSAHVYYGCKKHKCKTHVIKPYIKTFLGPVGACESHGKWGGTHSIYTGLRAVSEGGQYRGRYQFGIPGWRRAGGYGDPKNATATEQAYRAVLWLHINGRQSWPNC